MGARGWLFIALLPTLAVGSVGQQLGQTGWTDSYDPLFRKYTKHYFGAHFDWRWFKAQAIAESGLDPAARSPAGAIGIMQILPSTYREIRERNPFLASIEDPRWNIAAGIFYDRQLYRKWKRKPDLRTTSRLDFAFASYNAGFSGILKAHARAAADARVTGWEDVAPHAPLETRRYVERIRDLMQAAPSDQRGG
jgi:membrane-bound lytic murein transglycosylase F